MTLIGSGSRTTIAMIKEVTQGLTPAGNLKGIRHNSAKLNLKKEGYSSDEIRPDRQRSSYRHGFRMAEGGLECEISTASHDDLYEASLSGAWAAGASPVSVAANSSGNKLTRTGGSFVTDGILPGDVVTIAGFAGTPANNGTARVVSLTTLDLILDAVVTNTFAKTLVTDTGGTVALKGKRLKAGTTFNTYSFQQGFEDVAQYRMFLGMAVNDMELKFVPKEIGKVTFNFVGMDSSAFQGTIFAATDAVGTSNPLDSFSGGLWEGGLTTGLVTAISIKLVNGRSVEGVIGNHISPGVFEGKQLVNGNLTVFFQDAGAYNKFVAETVTSLDVLMLDPNGTDFLRFVVPYVKLGSGQIDPPASGPIHITMDFEAIVDPVSLTAFYMQRSNT